MRIRLREQRNPSQRILRWAVRNSFRMEDRLAYLRLLGRSASPEAVRRGILDRIAVLQARDTAYWSRRIIQLKQLRGAERLVPEGTPVRDLLR